MADGAQKKTVVPAQARKRKRDTRRAAIRAAALELFAEQGYDRTTLKDIAEQLGLTHPALYYYYKTKDALLFDAVRCTLEVLVEELEACLADEDLDGEAKVRRLIETQLIRQFKVRDSVRLVDAALFGSMSRSDIFDAEQHAALMALQRRMVGLYREALADGVREGLFEIEDPAIATFATLGAVSNVPYWFNPKGKLSQESVAENLASFILRSLKPAA